MARAVGKELEQNPPKPQRGERTCATPNLVTHVIFSAKDHASLVTASLHDYLLAFFKKHGIARDARYIWL
jgi:hypothetical protein